MPDFPFHVYLIEHLGTAHTVLPIHWHNETEIIYLAKGSAIFRIEEREYSLRAGDAVIVHPGELHSGTNSDTGEVVYSSIVFKLSWLSSFDHDRIQERYLLPILRGTVNLPSLLTCEITEHREPLNEIRRILTDYERKCTAYEMNIKASLLSLISSLYRNELMEAGSERAKRQDGDQHLKIKQILAYMDSHLADKIELSQLAAASGLSKSHFCKFFKDRTGMRPMEYLNVIRINKAAALLRTGSYSVIEAALESGFQHLSYFSKWFKACMNMTPSEYKAFFAVGA